MKRFVAVLLSVFVIILLVVLFVVYLWYRGAIAGDDPAAEKQRVFIDKQFESAWNQKAPVARILNASLPDNRDKYAWRPPRIVPLYTSDNTIRAYELYGMVTFWDPDAKLLGLNSYIGKTLFVRFDPDINYNYATVPNLDRWGGLLDQGVLPSVHSASDPRWKTLFCRSDIVAIVFSDKRILDTNSSTSPLIPISINLSQRICNL